jgi:hypothetical protein
MVVAPAVFFFGCAGGGGNGGGGGGTTTDLNVAAGQTQTLQSPLVVTGNAVVNGTLASSTGRIVLTVNGDLTLDGTLEALAPGGTPPTPQPDSSFQNQTSGIAIVAHGGVTFGPDARIRTDGPVVIADSADALNRTLSDAWDEVINPSDSLPTFVPLPPESPAYATAASVTHSAPSATAKQALPPLLFGGRWDFSGLPGDRPMVLVQFAGPRDVHLGNWEIVSPAAPAGQAADHALNPNDHGQNASGGTGKDGMRLNIRNNGGSIKITGNTVINLADGGRGGAATASCATASCATATGGQGGKPGTLRMTASDGIDMTPGALETNPGRGGDGGAATSTGEKGAAACPGVKGCDTTAIGGAGASSQMRLFARGSVDGLENVTINDVAAGNGGRATATAGDGGDGEECCDGGDGGDATATGGAGGAASLNVSGLPVTAVGTTGGTGGAATATGGKGGHGGDCKLDTAGDGGKGGKATATGGAGGGASGAGTPQAGPGGDATATGGNGGNGGDSAIQPGDGGAGGTAAATPGANGTPGNPPAASGVQTQNNGQNGQPGSVTPPTIVWCIPFIFLADGVVPPGVVEAPAFAPGNPDQIGTVAIDFRDIPGATYYKQSVPTPHIGWSSPGQVDFHIGEGPATPGKLAGVQISPLASSIVSTESPLIVQALDAAGHVLDTKTVNQVQTDPSNPQLGLPIAVMLNPGSSDIADVSISVGEGGFLYMWEICIYDP